MTIEQLAGRYFRLKQELDIAYRQTPWQSARIDRLAADIVTTEREIGVLSSSSQVRLPTYAMAKTATRSVAP